MNFKFFQRIKIKGSLCFVFCLIVFSTGQFSCRKKNTQPDRSEANEPITGQEPSPPSFRGVYVDNFLGMLGKPAAEDSLLNWCLKNDLNAISLYDAASAVATPANATLLNSFIGKAQAAPFHIHVSVVASNITIAVNEYTRYYKLFPNKFRAITTEYEFWNNGKSYTTFCDKLSYLQAIHDSTSGALKRQIYFSQFEDAQGIVTDEDSIAQKMVSSADKIFLVNYMPDAYEMTGTTLNKLKKIAAAAHALNKPIEIVILFNVNHNSVDPSLYNYFSIAGSNHRFADAYTTFKAEYDAENFSHKSYVRLIGFQLYRYSAAVKARPDLQ